MRRSLWKGPFFKKASPFGNQPNSSLNLSQYISRSSMILPSQIGKTFEIHNGKIFIKVTVTSEMVGHKFGEFSWTKYKYGTKS